MARPAAQGRAGEATSAARCGHVRGARDRPRHRHQAPEHAEDQEIVAPVVDVDDGALGRDADEGGIDRHDRSAATASRTNTKRKPDDEGHQRQRQVGEAAEPAARHEGVEERCCAGPRERNARTAAGRCRTAGRAPAGRRARGGRSGRSGRRRSSARGWRAGWNRSATCSIESSAATKAASITRPDDGDQHDAHAARWPSGWSQGQRHQHQRGEHELAPGAARKVSSSAAAARAAGRRAAHRATAGQHALQRHEAGSTRKAPSTFGSLKVPRARP